MQELVQWGAFGFVFSVLVIALSSVSQRGGQHYGYLLLAMGTVLFAASVGIILVGIYGMNRECVEYLGHLCER